MSCSQFIDYKSKKKILLFILRKYSWKPYHDFFLISLHITCDHFQVIVPAKPTLLPKSLNSAPHGLKSTQSILNTWGVALHPKLSRYLLGYNSKGAGLESVWGLLPFAASLASRVSMFMCIGGSHLKCLVPIFCFPFDITTYENCIVKVAFNNESSI